MKLCENLLEQSSHKNLIEQSRYSNKTVTYFTMQPMFSVSILSQNSNTVYYGKIAIDYLSTLGQ